MFKEILKIIPRLESGDLNKMERSLTQRFGKIAKKFGKGLVGALTGGGIAGIALGLIDKFLNPLKETQEAIDRVLKQGGDIVSNAEQFGTTAGKLFKLQKLAQSKGVDAENLNMLLSKFQVAIAEAKADPTKQTSVRRFVNTPDIAEGFFQFLQSVQKMDKNSQLLVQQEVFGEKQILKIADFFNSNMNELTQKVGAAPAEEYTRGLMRIDYLSDMSDILEARRDLDDMIAKSRVINQDMVKSRDAQLRIELERENQRIQSYKSLATISEASTRIAQVVERGFLILTDMATRITGLSEIVKKLSSGRLMRGLGLGKDE
jgi:hypothetical protein